MLMNTSCIAWTVLNQAGIDHHLHNLSNNTIGITGDCVGGGVFAHRIVAFYDRVGCGNACPYYFDDSGSFSGDHFVVYNSAGFFTATCGATPCGELIALADDGYYRARTFLNANHCVDICNAVCGK